MRILVFGLLCIVLTGCEAPPVDLGNGYQYVDFGPSNAIVKDGRAVVHPAVSMYRVILGYILGERIAPPSILRDPVLSKKYGYFILDMRNGVLVEGLDEKEFKAALRKRNLDIEPF